MRTPTILVAEAESVICDLLEQEGYTILSTCSTGHALIKDALQSNPEFLVVDIHLKGMNGLAALEYIFNECYIPTVVVTSDRSSTLLKKAIALKVLGYLIKPATHQLPPAIDSAWFHYIALNNLTSENCILKQALKDRKIIEHARRVIMRKKRWDEDRAFKAIQHIAMARRTHMTVVSKEILDGIDPFVSMR